MNTAEVEWEVELDFITLFYVRLEGEGPPLPSCPFSQLSVPFTHHHQQLDDLQVRLTGHDPSQVTRSSCKVIAIIICRPAAITVARAALIMTKIIIKFK